MRYLSQGPVTLGTEVGPLYRLQRHHQFECLERLFALQIVWRKGFEFFHHKVFSHETLVVCNDPGSLNTTFVYVRTKHLINQTVHNRLFSTKPAISFRVHLDCLQLLT